jgi:hypothetical protein
VQLKLSQLIAKEQMTFARSRKQREILMVIMPSQQRIGLLMIKQWNWPLLNLKSSMLKRLQILIVTQLMEEIHSQQMVMEETQAILTQEKQVVRPTLAMV